MESLIFTCLCHAATQLRETRLHPLQLLPVLSAAHDEGEQVFLQEAGWTGAMGAGWGYSPTVSHPADQFLSPPGFGNSLGKHRKRTRYLKVMRLR